MPTGVPREPGFGELASHVVGAPVSASHGFHWEQELLFLLARNAPVVTSQVFPTTSLSPAIYRIAYRRNPAARLLCISVELHQATADGRATVGVTASTGSITWLASGGLDGATDLDATLAMLSNYTVFRGLLDIEAETASSTLDLIFTHTTVSGTLNGIYRITISEIPTATVSPDSAPTTEVGASAGWTQADRRLVDGTSSTADGFVRLIAGLDQARTAPRSILQITAPESTGAGGAWRVVLGFASAIPFGGGGSDPVFRVRVPLLYTGVAAKYQIRTRHATSGANTGHVGVLVVPVGGVGATTTINLATSAGVFINSTLAINLPNTGTDQEVDISFAADTNAGTLYLSSIELIPVET